MADCSTLLQQGLQLVQRATECDRSGDFESALRLYSLALEAFLSVLKMERNPKIVQTLNSRILEYMNRAEELKRMLRPELTGNNPPPTERVDANEWLALPSVPDGSFEPTADPLSDPLMALDSPELAARLARLSLPSSLAVGVAGEPSTPEPPPPEASPWQTLTFGLPPSGQYAGLSGTGEGRIPREEASEDRFGAIDSWKDLLNPSESAKGETPPLPGLSSPMLLFPSPPGASGGSVSILRSDEGNGGVDSDATLDRSTSGELRVGTTSIAENSLGHSFESLFGFLLKGASEVCVQEPDVRTASQLQDFLRFAELCVKVGHSNKIVFVTNAPENKAIQHELETVLDEIASSLMDQLIDLEVHFTSERIVHSQILCSTGWGARLTRGLDVFKPPAGRFHIGCFDLSFRPTHAFTIELFRDE